MIKMFIHVLNTGQTKHFIVQMTCDGYQHSYDLKLKKSQSYCSNNISIKDKCEVVVYEKSQHLFGTVSTNHFIGEFTILSQEKNNNKIFNEVNFYWFEINKDGSKAFNINAITCYQKYNGMMFKDRIRLETCTDNNECVSQLFSFETEKTIEIKQPINFSSVLFLRLWNVKYGLKERLSLIGEFTINDDSNAQTILVAQDNMRYSVDLELT